MRPRPQSSKAREMNTLIDGMRETPVCCCSAIRLIFVLVLFLPAARGKCEGNEPNETEGEAAAAPLRVEVKTGVAYGDGDERSDHCDLYLPRRDGDQALTPVVLTVHGGAWMSGDKWTMRNHSYQLAKRGIAAVSINYRLAPKHKFPKQLDDLREALAWIGDNAEEHRFDLNRVGLYGYSAGGHLVSSIATLQDEPWESVSKATEWKQSDPRWSKLPKVVGVLAGAPPMDFEGLPEENTAMVYFLGGTRKEHPDVYRAASPYAHISKADPPIHIVHGDADLLVPIKTSRRFIERSKERESETALTTVPRNGHFLTYINPKLAETLLDFFEKRFNETD